MKLTMAAKAQNKNVSKRFLTEEIIVFFVMNKQVVRYFADPAFCPRIRVN